MRVQLSVALSVAVCLSGCRRDDGPVERYRAFAAAARAGAQAPDAASHATAAAAVWEMLSRKTRAEMDARAKALAAGAPSGVVPVSGADLVLGASAVGAERLRSVVVVRESQEAAVLSVRTEGGGPAREVTLVREDGAWRVVVPFDN